MAGSGDLSSIGWQRALNAAVGSAITGAAMQGPPGDLIGTLTTGLTADVAATSLALSGGTNKALPNNAVLLISAAAGGTNTWDIATVNGAASSGATSITVQSFRPHVARSNGDLIYLIGFVPYLALNTTAPTQTALGTEYSATGYARQPVTYTATTGGTGGSLSANPSAANNSTITFGPFTAGTGSTVSNGSIMDASSGGTAANQYAYFTWGTSKTPGTNDSLQVAGAALSLAGS